MFLFNKTPLTFFLKITWGIMAQIYIYVFTPNVANKIFTKLQPAPSLFALFQGFIAPISPPPPQHCLADVREKNDGTRPHQGRAAASLFPRRLKTSKRFNRRAHVSSTIFASGLPATLLLAPPCREPLRSPKARRNLKKSPLQCLQRLRNLRDARN
jgi:hypothetical protein